MHLHDHFHPGEPVRRPPWKDRRDWQRALRKLEDWGVLELRKVRSGRAGQGVAGLVIVRIAPVLEVVLPSGTTAQFTGPARRPSAVARPRRQEAIARIRAELGDRCKLCGGPYSSIKPGTTQMLVSCRKCMAPWPPTPARRAAYVRALGVDLRLPDDPRDLVTAR